MDSVPHDLYKKLNTKLKWPFYLPFFKKVEVMYYEKNKFKSRRINRITI